MMKSLKPLSTRLPYLLVAVLCDYFATNDAESVAKLMAETGGESPLIVHNGPLAGVEAEGIDPAVALGKIVALILGVEWEPGLVPARPVWEADLECHEGPWVLEIREIALHALTSLTGNAAGNAGPSAPPVTDLAAAGNAGGARIPELVGSLPNTDPRWLAETLESLAALAKQTMVRGEKLFRPAASL
jgi:hypothetical protein